MSTYKHCIWQPTDSELARLDVIVARLADEIEIVRF